MLASLRELCHSMPKDRHKLMYTHDYDFLLERLLQSPVYLCHESQLGTKDSGADLLVVIELHAGRLHG